MAHEIHGIEYEYILLINPISKKLSDYVQSNRLSVDMLRSHHRASGSQKSNGDINIELKRLFVAITRAKNTLYIESKSCSSLAFFQSLVTPETQQAKKEEKITTSSNEDWLNEAKTLLKKGCIHQAEAIFIDRLYLSISDFNSFRSELHVTSLMPSPPIKPVAKMELSNEGKMLRTLSSIEQPLKNDHRNKPQPVKHKKNKNKRPEKKEIVESPPTSERNVQPSSKVSNRDIQKARHLEQMADVDLDTALVHAFKDKSMKNQIKLFLTLPETVKEHEGLILQILQPSSVIPLLYTLLPPELQASSPICQLIIRKLPQLFRKMPEQVRAIPSIANLSIPLDGTLLEFACDSSRSNPLFICGALINSREAYKAILITDNMPYLKDYKKISTIEDDEARRNYCTFIAGKSFLDMISAEERTLTSLSQFINSHPTMLQSKSRQHMMLLIFMFYNGNIFPRILIKNHQLDPSDIEQYALLALVKSPSILEELPSQFQAHSQFRKIASIQTENDRFLKALELYGEYIIVAPNEIRQSKEAIAIASQTWPYAYYYAEEAPLSNYSSDASINGEREVAPSIKQGILQTIFKTKSTSNTTPSIDSSLEEEAGKIYKV